MGDFVSVLSDVQFGSKADICSAKRHVRFTPNCDSESGLPAKVMSALPFFFFKQNATESARKVSATLGGSFFACWTEYLLKPAIVQDQSFQLAPALFPPSL